MHIVPSDPTGRTAGQYARATVRRLRMRTLVILGVLAVATASLGRLFGLHDVRFLASEVALLVSMFVISRYVLPLLERRDRGATGEEEVGELLEGLGGEWRVEHDVSLGRGNVDHVLVGPAGVFTVETKSHPGPVRVGRVHGRMLSQAQAMLTRNGADPVTANRQATAMLYGMVQQQASVLSFLTVFRIIGAVFLAIIPLVLILRKPKHLREPMPSVAR